MGEEKLLTVREVSSILGISEKEVVDLAESGAMPAYKIGGVYLRFKKEQVQEYKKSIKSLLPESGISRKYLLKDKISDFIYFNDFYILSVIVVLLLLMIIFQG
jgi:excisionase family DNA binding protein